MRHFRSSEELFSSWESVRHGEVAVIVAAKPGERDRRRNHDTRRKGAALVDSDTNTGWSVDGIAVDGSKERKGKKLRAVLVEEDVYWGVMKWWYPEMQLVGKPKLKPE